MGIFNKLFGGGFQPKKDTTPKLRAPVITQLWSRESSDAAAAKHAFVFTANGLSEVQVELVRDFGGGVAVFRLKGNWVDDASKSPRDNPVRCFSYDRDGSTWRETQKYTPAVLALDKEQIVEIERLTRRKYGRKDGSHFYDDPYPYDPDKEPNR